MKKRRTTKKAVAAWKEARAQSYARRLSPLTIATMLVDLEDDGGYEPEFGFQDPWPGEGK